MPNCSCLCRWGAADTCSAFRGSSCDCPCHPERCIAEDRFEELVGLDKVNAVRFGQASWIELVEYVEWLAAGGRHERV